MEPTKRNKHIVWDVVGTLVDNHTHFFSAINERLGPSLREHNVSAQLLGFAWLESAEREYTYLSLSGRYVPFGQVFEALFFRVLHFAGVSEPRRAATESDVKYLIGEYSKCEVRAGAKECVEKLVREGWTVWAFSSGDRERVQGYLTRGNVPIHASRIITCDEIGVGKPEIRAYQRVRERIGIKEGEEIWFAAAHGWDVSAAGRTGFKTAYCKALEKEPLEELFGKMDVVSDTLPELADGLIKCAFKD